MTKHSGSDLAIIFVRSGNIHPRSGALANFGATGWKWSSVVSASDLYSYFLGIVDGEVKPSRADARWLGFPVRCLVILVNLELLLFPNTDCHKVEKALI